MRRLNEARIHNGIMVHAGRMGSRSVGEFLC